MKIYINELSKHLTGKSLAPIYIIGGSEPLQILESKTLIIDKAKTKGFTNRQVLQVDKDFKWDNFISLAYNVSLFATKSIIELQIKTLNETGKKLLIEYASKIPTHNIVIIILEKIDSSITKAKWFKALDVNAIYFSVWPVEINDLPKWIINRFKLDGFSISSEHAYLIADKVEGNLVAAACEIEKLKTLNDTKVISLATIKQSIVESSKFDAYKLADKTLEGDLKSALRILARLKETNGEHTIILWALAREARMLNHLARLKANAVGEDKIYQSLTELSGTPLFFIKRRAHLLFAALNRHTETSIREIIMLAATTDKSIKGFINNNPWELLKILVEKICGCHIIKLAEGFNSLP